jgi:hypothetical protein
VPPTLAATIDGGNAKRMQWFCPWPSGWQDTGHCMGFTAVPGSGERQNSDRAALAKQQLFKKRHIRQS